MADIVVMAFARRQHHGRMVDLFVAHLPQQMVDAVEAGPALVVGLNGEPGGFWDVCMFKHFIFGLGKFGSLHAGF